MSEKVASRLTGNFTGNGFITYDYKPHKYVIFL